MPVTILDLITGQVILLAQAVSSGRPIMTFEMQFGGTRALAEIIARPDTLKILDMTSRASLTYNQAVAAQQVIP